MLGLEGLQTAVRVVGEQGRASVTGPEPLERLPERITGVEALGRLDPQASLDNRSDAGVDRRRGFTHRDGRPLEHPPTQLGRRQAAMRRSPHAQDVEQDPQGIDVGLAGRRLGLPQFRGHVVGRADQGPRLGERGTPATPISVQPRGALEQQVLVDQRLVRPGRQCGRHGASVTGG